MPLHRLPFGRQLCAALACLVAFASAPARAEDTLKVGYLKTYALLPLYRGIRNGYFKNHGLELELVTLNNGPAVASAVSSGSLDIGYAAVLPIVAARSRGEGFRFFAATSYESENQPTTFYIASERSGVKSFKDMAGKTMAINTAGGGCDLGGMEHAEAAGIEPSSVKRVTIPFPQMQATLELGNADMVCTVDPFYTSIMQSKRIGARLITTLPVVGMHGKVMIDGFFATEKWLAANQSKAVAFVAGLEEGARDLLADPPLMPQLLTEEMKFSPEIAKLVKIYPVGNSAIEPSSMQPLIDAMKRRQFITTDIKAADVVYALPRK